MKCIRFLGILALMLFIAESTAQTVDTSLPCVTKEGVLAPGIVVDIDYPIARRMKNIGGSDGAGLCVYTSVTHDFDWHSYEWCRDFRAWAARRPGGSWPEKLARDIREFAASKGLEPPDVLQCVPASETPLAKVVDLLAECLKSGHMAGVTYCYSPTPGRYNGRIAHMVNCVGARLGANRDIWAIMDNNYPDSIQWMDEKTFVKVFSGNGGGWFVVVLNKPDPPPVPRNMESGK